MRKRLLTWAAMFSAAITLLAAWLIFQRPSQQQGGPFRHEVYVWQRNWNEPVHEAVQHHGSNFVNLVALRAEVTWKDAKPQIARVAVDYPTLTNAPCPVGLALRIGPFSGPFAKDDPAIKFLCDVASSLVAQAQTNALRLSELQVDFDCAESKLDGYCIWVDAIRDRVAPLPVTITALPSWLNAPAFRRLATAATNYVLQVHSVERPRSFDAPFTLCDPSAAMRAVQRAGRIGVPFRVALPTYGYLLAFDKSGKFIGLSAEGPRPNWPPDAQLREVGSDPRQLSQLVQSWTSRRPAAMRSVIWYRLPIETDTLNWRWPTLGAIVAGRSPRESLRSEPRRVEAGLVEIHLVNDGELDNSSRLAVEVRWSNARLIAGDGLRDFELAEQGISSARFQTQATTSRLRAGDNLKLGWLRFDRDCEVQIEVKRL